MGPDANDDIDAGEEPLDSIAATSSAIWRPRHHGDGPLSDQASVDLETEQWATMWEEHVPYTPPDEMPSQSPRPTLTAA